MKINEHSGLAKYTGTIETSVARLLLIIKAASMAELVNVRFTAGLTSKKFTGTILPELSIDQLADVAGTIHGMSYCTTEAGKVVFRFSVPISFEGCYDNSDGIITYSLQGCDPATEYAIYTLEDPKMSSDFFTVTKVGTQVGSAKPINVIDCVYLFVDPSKLSRIKVSYANSKQIEYSPEEVTELARLTNEIQSVDKTSGNMTAGYNVYCGLNVVDAIEVEVTMTTADDILVLKHIK